MKKALWIALLLAFGITAHAQYHVLHVEGSVVERSSNELVKVGQQLPQEALVALRSRNAKLCVWHPAKGRLISKPPKPSQANVTPPFEQIASLLQPGGQGRALPAKPLLESKEDIIAYLKRGDFLFLGPTSIRVSATEFPMDNQRSFFFRFSWEKRNTEPVAKLAHRSDSLILDPQLFLNMNSLPVPANEASNFELVYYAGSKTYVEICAFKPVFPDMEALLAETKALVTHIQASKTLQLDIRAEVLGFLADCHGHPDGPAFDLWLNAHFQIH